MLTDRQPAAIPVVTGRRRPLRSTETTIQTRQRVLVKVSKCSLSVPRSKQTFPPSLYVLNAAAVTKPHAIEHLTADLLGYKTDIAVITETHLKKKHSDELFAIDGYTLYRRDRTGRRGGGVAVYVVNHLQATVWTCSGDSLQYELRIGVGTSAY